MVQQTDEVARQAAVEAVEGTKRVSEVRLSNGILLGVKQVPPLLIRRAQANVRKPEVPVVWIEAKGREEENPNHPDYLKALDDYEQQVNDAALNVVLLTGTTIKEVPEGISRPEDDDWLETLEALGVAPNVTSRPARYLAWLQLVALASLQDFFIVGEAVGIASGLREEDVQQAIESFRGGEERGADNAVSVPEIAQNGNHISSASVGPGAGD